VGNKHVRRVRNVVVLSGGFGNQLFQLANGLSTSNGLNLQIFVYPTKQIEEQESFVLSHFKINGLDSETTRIRTETSFFTRKAMNFKLRLSGVFGSSYKRTYFLPVEQIIDIYLAFKFRERRATHTCTWERALTFKDIFGTKVLVGYFQGLDFEKRVDTSLSLKQMKLKNTGPNLKKYIELAKIEKPLVVHIRLGDFLKEPDFFHLSVNYFNEALNNLWNTETFKKIWVFSNDVEGAREYVPKAYRTLVREIPKVDNSDLSTFELMRWGEGYILANSTFGWWAAYTSHSSEAKVILPNKWFTASKAIKIPIPEGWKTIDSQ